MNLLLAHDYLIQMGGAERVVAAMHHRHPAAPIYTSAVNRETLWQDFADATIRTTWLQSAPLVTDHIHFKKYFPLYAAAFRSFGAVDADCAWISSSTFAKYMRFSPRTRTVCYMHNPTRFLWQTDEYIDHEIRQPALRALVRAMLPTLREADRAAARRMDVVVANSRNVQQRIRDCYGLDSIVVPPPVRTERFRLSPGDDGYHLVASRLVGYKNVDLAVRAFTAAGKNLVVLGDGPHRPVLEQLAGPTVKIVGRLSEQEAQACFEKCRGLVFPGDEDFGIAPVEAMACGKPVLAFARGGALETVIDGETGILFPEPTVESLLAGLDRCENQRWDAARLRAHAGQFSEERFLDRMDDILRTASKRTSADGKSG